MIRDHVERRPSRLGVYSDGPFDVIDVDGRGRLAPDPADVPFLTFAYEVGRHFDATVLFARARRATSDPGRPLLPDEVAFVELPFFESLTRLGALVRALPGTVREFWRGLERVDAVWVLGPHPFALVLVPLAVARRKRVVLGVRQDTMAYYRSRLPSRRWTPALVAAWTWDLGFRVLARRLPTTVVGPELARRYGRDGSALAFTVALIRDADVVTVPAERDWSGEVALFTVGRVDREKNPLLVVETIAKLEAARPGRFRLAWAGTGPLVEEVRRRASERGVAERIDLLGFVPFGPELVDRYRTAHVFVHVSLTEGVPATVVEALGSGTPVVATAVGGLQAMLEHGGAGMLVEPSDADGLVAAILALVDDADLRARLTTRGLEVARLHTLEGQAARVARFIADGTDGGHDLDEGTVRASDV